MEGGKYADTETLCQVFHICIIAGPGSTKLRPASFLCPNGTLFNQEYFICDWWFNVDCTIAEEFYGLNDDVYAASEEANQVFFTFNNQCLIVRITAELLIFLICQSTKPNIGIIDLFLRGI